MSSSLPLILNRPSEFYTAVVDGLIEKISGDVDVKRYADFNSQEVSGIQLYVEVSGFHPATRQADGRRAQKLMITVHCLVSRAIEGADLKALDLASAVDRIVDLNRWGLGGSVEAPKNVTAGEGMIGAGENAFEGWEVSWSQTVYLGESASYLDEKRGGIRFAINPADASDPNEYQPLEVSGAS